MLFGALWGPLEGSWEALGRLLDASWSLLGIIWQLWNAPRQPFGRSWRLLDASWDLLERSWSLLERSWESLGNLSEAFWKHFGALRDDFGARTAVSKRFVEMLKNLEKRCKVLQKSRFRESEIYEKISLEGNLTQKLMLSWLVKVQVGAKRAKLTRSWKLRGTKLELKGSLGAPKKAPSASKGHD